MVSAFHLCNLCHLRMGTLILKNRPQITQTTQKQIIKRLRRLHPSVDLSESMSQGSKFMRRFILLIQLLTLSVLVLSSSFASVGTGGLPKSNWSQWRGPEGNGVSAETNLPTEWSDTKNIKWKTPIVGRGHSSPVVWENKIFLTTDIEGETVPGAKAVGHTYDGKPFKHPDSVGADKKHSLRVLCINRDSGKILWEQTAYEGTVYDDRHRKSTYASPTPATDGTCVFAYFGTEG